MTLLHQVEAAALRTGIWLSRQMSPVSASNLGGRVARAIGPWLPVSRIADANLRLAIPHLGAAERGRGALAHLSAGGFLGVMVDQEMNDGIPVAFVGRDAMPAPALAHFALRFQCPVIPVHVQRRGPARFCVVCDAPLALPATGDRAT